jgi:hypothetical protein
VVGITVGMPMFALTLRFAFKPILDAYVRLREVKTHDNREVEALKLRIAALEAVWEHRLGAGTLDPPTTPKRVQS